MSEGVTSRWSYPAVKVPSLRQLSLIGLAVPEPWCVLGALVAELESSPSPESWERCLGWAESPH